MPALPRLILVSILGFLALLIGVTSSIAAGDAPVF